MSDRYALATQADQLRALLAKSERRLSLSAPLRSSDLYNIAIRHIQAAQQEIERVLKEAIPE